MTLTRKAPMTRKTPMKQQAFKRSDSKEAGAVAKVRRMKSKGMVGRTPTAEEARFMDAMAKLGCLACAKDGVENSNASIHHIDGRTKPGAHFLTLALCAPHHQQDDTDPEQRISLHGSKKEFTKRYGTERELLAEAVERIGGAKQVAAGIAPSQTSMENDLSTSILPESEVHL